MSYKYQTALALALTTSLSGCIGGTAGLGISGTYAFDRLGGMQCYVFEYGGEGSFTQTLMFLGSQTKDFTYRVDGDEIFFSEEPGQDPTEFFGRLADDGSFEVNGMSNVRLTEEAGDRHCKS
jgi:hypothetical protein